MFTLPHAETIGRPNATGPPGAHSSPKPGDDGQLRQRTKPSPP
jgi:hypothetical protein